MWHATVAPFLPQVLSVAFPSRGSRKLPPNRVFALALVVMVVRLPGIESTIPRVPNQAALTVVAPPLLEVGQTVRLRTVIKGSAVGSQPERVKTWISSDTGVARITSDGVVSALAVGQVTLTAAIGNVTGSTVV